MPCNCQLKAALDMFCLNVINENTIFFRLIPCFIYFSAARICDALASNDVSSYRYVFYDVFFTFCSMSIRLKSHTIFHHIDMFLHMSSSLFSARIYNTVRHARGEPGPSGAHLRALQERHAVRYCIHTHLAHRTGQPGTMGEPAHGMGVHVRGFLNDYIKVINIALCHPWIYMIAHHFWPAYRIVSYQLINWTHWSSLYVPSIKILNESHLSIEMYTCLKKDN